MFACIHADMHAFKEEQKVACVCSCFYKENEKESNFLHVYGSMPFWVSHATV